MRLSLYHHPAGVETQAGLRVAYDLEADEAHFGAAAVSGEALRWELEEEVGDGALLSSLLQLDPTTEWLVRCDRIDFPPGGVAHLHTHPGPGIRCLLFGELTVETEGSATTHGRLGAWFESGPAPVRAVASPTADTAFVRVMLLPREWEGRRTIRYVDPADADRPKRQRARIYFDQPVGL